MRPKKRILVADNNEQSLSVRKFQLETRGYHVLACNSSREALALAAEGNLDLIIANLAMPEVDGAELVRRAKSFNPQMPAILFSTRLRFYDKDMPAEVFIPMGMDSPAEMIERIRVLLVRKRGPKKSAQQPTAVSAAS
jgi:two-component system response regulator CpxR